jgi:hypothetical protein
MSNIVNTYPINNHLEVYVCDDDGTRVFVIVNTDNGIEEQISEYAARAICINPDSTITTENFEDFCNATRQFCENN